MAEGNGKDRGGLVRFLVTGTDLPMLDAFLIESMPLVDAIDMRGRTLFFQVLARDGDGALEHLLRAARKTGATLQRARPRKDVPAGAPPEAYWEVIHQGEAPAWSRALEEDDKKGGDDAAAAE